MEKKKKNRLLVIGASDFQLPAILKAKEMGLIVGVVDMNPNAIGVPYADKFYCISTIDELGVSNAAHDFRADGIITLCTDMPMRALSRACETLGLKGLDYQSAIRSTDKGEMIRAFEDAGVPHPSYIVVSSGEEINSNVSKIEKCLNYPLITKPTDNSGSRGIMRVDNRSQLISALEYSWRNSRGNKVIVEEFMQGPEVSVEIVVVEGKPHILQITDKLTSGAPHFVEIGHSEPSRLKEHEKRKIEKIAARAALAVGIQDGAAHAEIIVTENGPKMVEIGARMGGGCITTHLVPFSTGIDMTKAVIQVALGEKPNLKQQFNKGSAIRFICPSDGVVKSISGIENARNIEGIKEIEIQCKCGQKLTELENGTSRIGYVIAQDESVEKAIEICEKALKCINIEIE